MGCEGDDFLKSVALGGGVGAFVGSVVCAWNADSNPENTSLKSNFKATARVVGQFTALAAGICAVFHATRCVSKSIRAQDDFLNDVAAGAAGGAFVALAGRKWKLQKKEGISLFLH